MRTRQLKFVFAASPQGGGKSGPSKASVGRDFLLHTASRWTSNDLGASAADACRLLEAAASPAILATALLNVVRNKGAPGVDGCSVDEVLGSARSLLPRLQRALLNGTCQPGDIRRVWIPKPGGGQRGLGIPNVIDRWVQQTVLEVLEPIFEPTFHSSSHGFRPKRAAHTAIAEAKEYVGDGYGAVVDIDLSKFFDRVHHQRLLSRPGHKVSDSRILKLIAQMLKANVVMPDGTRVCTDEGTPQGGPLSPLLSNVVLDEFNKELARRGLRGWSSYFRICTEENVYRLHVWDAHIRRRLRAILVRQKKRLRHIYRHLQHRGASSPAATHTAWCRKGVWYRSKLLGNDRGLPERLVPRASGVTGLHLGEAQPACETGLWSNPVVRPVRLKPKEPDV